MLKIENGTYWTLGITFKLSRRKIAEAGGAKQMYNDKHVFP